MNNSDNVKYSIIIPHYNSPATLEKLLSTIPIRDDIQVIVIDDYSTDYIDELNKLMASQKHVIFYRNDTGIKNAGTCRNIGLKYATGKWIFFADADDFFTPDFLSIAETYYESDYEVIFISPISLNLLTDLTSDRHLPYQYAIRKYSKNPNRRNEMVLKYRYCSPCSKMIKRSFLEKFNIEFEAVEVANDVMFSTKLSYCLSSFSTCSQPIYCITKSGGTLTTAVTKDRFAIRRSVFFNRCSFLRNNLTESDWRKTKISGKNLLIQAYKRVGGMKTFNETYKLLRKHKIRIATWENYDVLYQFWKLKNGKQNV